MIEAVVVREGLVSPAVHVEFDRGYVVGEPKRVTRVVGMFEPEDVPGIIEKLQRAYTRATGAEL